MDPSVQPIDVDVILDRREWPYDSRFRALGYAFRVRSDLEGADRVVGRLLAPFADTTPPAGRVATYTLTHRLSSGGEAERATYCYELFQDGQSIQRVATPGSMLDWVILDSTRHAVEGLTRYVGVHAAVASLHGRAVLMPAPPDSGKTTLVAGLTRGGFQFLGDEVALIEPETMLVHPFLRPLLIERGSMAVLDGLASDLPAMYGRFRGVRYQVAAEDLRTGAEGSPCPIAYAVLPRYREGSATRLQPISRATALMRVWDQTFNRSGIGTFGIRTLANVLRGAECFELPIGDLHEAIQEIRSLFEPSRDARSDITARPYASSRS
jgi:hypothetical protein